jgi:septal ring factor EnvC (AmiA/AmiB activator)
MRCRAALLLLLGATGLAQAQARPGQLPPSAQQAAERLRQEQIELDRLRAERTRAERRNLERQAQQTSQVVRSLEQQLGSLVAEVENVNEGLARSQDELAIKRATLMNRVQEIYKRGPLYTFEALLSAESFGALVARYKYLHLVARRDRALVKRVEALTGQITAQRFLLERLRGNMESNRQQKAEEEARLRRLETARGRTLAGLQEQARQQQQRLEQMLRDEQRMRSMIAALEESRRRTEARGTAPRAAGTLTTAEIGRLDWPVEGTIVYRHGRVINPNNTEVTWHGIGISAPLGTPVRAVAAGEVVWAESNGTYGLMVVLQHGGGAYSSYSSLQQITVRKGARVAKGETIGTVGQSDPDLPPRLHFEIRPNGTVSVDPLDWLRRQQ